MRVIKFEDNTEILKIAIYTEDTYGPAFIRKVINRLIKDGKIKIRKFLFKSNFYL